MPDILLIGQANVTANFLPKIQDEVTIIREIINTKASRYLFPSLLPFTAKSVSEEFNNPIVSGKIKFLHYAGHSSQKGIAFQENGIMKLMSKDNLVAFLKNQDLRFVFLNSCLSESIAKDLHEAGVPVVIGTTDKVRDEDAVRIAKEFYAALAGKPGRTLLQAFEDTATFFKNNPGELKQNYHFRGIGSDEDPTQEFAWNIYAEAASEADKNWCLIPAKNYKLSSAGLSTQKKIFCLYDKGLKDYYEPFVLHGAHEFDALINGIWDISEDDVTLEDVLPEWEAADCIIHLLDSGYARLQPFLDPLTPEQFHKKNHLFINVDNQSLIVDWLKTKNIYEEARLFPSAQSWIRNLGAVQSLSDLQKLLSFNPLKSFQNVLLSELKPFFAGSLTPEQIGRELEQFDFEEEKKTYKADAPKLFFTLIEGTSDCAQPLLVKLIKNRVGIKPNVNIQVLKVTGNPSISNEFLFGFELVNLLQIKPKSGNFLKECANALLDRAEASVVVFDCVETVSKDLYQNQIINGLWQELLTEYQARLQVPGYVLQHSVMLFTLNYEKIGLPIPTALALGGVQIDKKSPVSPLSKEEFNTWYGARSQNSAFKGLDNERASIENQPRRKAMLEICRFLHCDPSIIDTQVLKLS
ncbi:MAG: CHAT domain-containing protein [Spirosomataceae bacterium]